MTGNAEDPFIYRIRWDRDRTITPADLATLDRTIYLRPAAGDHLVRLSGLLRPLIQRQWIRMLTEMRSNTGLIRTRGLPLRRRAHPARPRPTGLRELQNDRCFFCESRLGSRVDVDHFIPWSRYPGNAIENLVVADAECNARKKDFLAASPHVSRWSTRQRTHASDLRTIAERATWESAGELPRNVARAIYLALRGDARLWLRDRDFVPPDHAEIEGALS